MSRLSTTRWCAGKSSRPTVVGLLGRAIVLEETPERPARLVETLGGPRPDEDVELAVAQEVAERPRRELHPPGQRVRGRRRILCVHASDHPLDAVQGDALLAHEGAAPRVPAVGPAVHGDAPPGEVPNGPERAVPAHVEGPVTELAHHEEGQPHQRPVARRVPLDVAAERRLPALHGGIARHPLERVERADQGQVQPVGGHVAGRERGHEVVVAGREGERRCRHRWILPAHLYHGPGARVLQRRAAGRRGRQADVRRNGRTRASPIDWPSMDRDPDTTSPADYTRQEARRARSKGMRRAPS